MKIYTILFLALFTSPLLFGQGMLKQTLSQNGASGFVYSNHKSYFFQQSIGQASVINTYSSNNYELRQGFLQAIKASLVNNGFDTEIEVNVYPNPFQGNITLDFEETLIDVITISLYHIAGQLIYQEDYDPIASLSLQFNDLPIGAYILRGQMRSQTFVIKLIKH